MLPKLALMLLKKKILKCQHTLRAIYLLSEADIFIELPLIISCAKFELNTSCGY